jgi:Ferritin-like domain
MKNHHYSSDINDQSNSHNRGRRGFLQVLAASGIGLGSSVLLGQRALAAAGEITDLDILQLATTAEYLAVDVYYNVTLCGFDGLVKEYIDAARDQENEHLDALQKTIRSLGATPVARPEFAYPVRFDIKNQIPVLRVMNALEDAFVGAYLGALPLIKNKDILAAAAAIMGNEATHRCLIRQSRINLGDETVKGVQVGNDRAFEQAITPAQATAAVTGFVKK